MNENKLCIACGNGILQSAKKCPLCHTWQSGLLPGPFKDQFMGTAILGVAVLLLLMMVSSRCGETRKQAISFSTYKDQLTITGSKVHFSSPYVSCIGAINNNTGHAWSDLVIEVHYLDASGDLIDTMVSRDGALTLPPRSTVAFRVRGMSDKPQDSYASHKVILRWAASVK